MRWWAKSGGWWSACLACALVGAATGLLVGRTAAVPSLAYQALAPVPVTAILALLPIPFVVRLWEATALEVTGLATFSLWQRAAAAHLALVGLTAAGAWVTGGSEAAFETARNVAGLSGLAVIAASRLSTGWTLGLPVGYALLCFLLGRSDGSTAQSWAWLIQGGGVATTHVAAGSILLVGLLTARSLPTQRALHPGD